MSVLQTNQASDDEDTGIHHSQILLLPTVVEYLDLRSLVKYREVCKLYKECVDDTPEVIGYWRAMCRSLASYAGLYSPILDENEWNACYDGFINHKKHFFDALWPSRSKWANSAERMVSGLSRSDEGDNYKIKVMCRFRPGVREADKMQLPFHQFIRVRRHQIKKFQQQQHQVASASTGRAEEDGDCVSKSSGGITTSIFNGSKDPEEFVDPLLGTLMKDPVMLQTSQRIVDKSVAIQSVLRGGKDPFNGKKLNMTMLIPQPELNERIAVWRSESAQRHKESCQLDESDVKSCFDEEASMKAELLDLLIEAERLQRASALVKRQEMIAASDGDADALGNDPETLVNNQAAAMEDLLNNQQLLDGVLALNGIAAPAGGVEEMGEDQLLAMLADVAGGNSRGEGDDSDGDEENGAHQQRKAETARILDINEPKFCVSMHVPGQGVKPFYFSGVHGEKSTQNGVYNFGARDSVAAALNGYNSCVLCYGQTGSGKTYTFFGPEGSLEQYLLDAHSQSKAAEFQQQGQEQTPSSFSNAESARSEGVQQTISTPSPSTPSPPPPASSGFVIRACSELLTAQVEMRARGVQVSYAVQYIEIYEDKPIDLLTGYQVSIRRDSGEVIGAKEVTITSLNDVIEVLVTGQARKRFASTAMNDRSSRSHTAFIVQVLQTLNPQVVSQRKECLSSHLTALCGLPAGGSGDVAGSSGGSGGVGMTEESEGTIGLEIPVPAPATSAEDESATAPLSPPPPAAAAGGGLLAAAFPAAGDPQAHQPVPAAGGHDEGQIQQGLGSGALIIKSQLHLIDLAGSERVKKSKVTGQQKREAAGINRSLLVLGRVISALVTSQRHVPYLESKLTTLLKSAFGGNSVTTAFINCRSDDAHGDETLQSLMFGERCSMISNSLKQAASSFASAIAKVDEALSTVRTQIQSLEMRGKQDLPTYKKLVLSAAELARKRKEMDLLEGKPVSGNRSRRPSAGLRAVSASPDHDSTPASLPLEGDESRVAATTGANA